MLLAKYESRKRTYIYMTNKYNSCYGLCNNFVFRKGKRYYMVSYDLNHVDENNAGFVLNVFKFIPMIISRGKDYMEVRISRKFVEKVYEFDIHGEMGDMFFILKRCQKFKNVSPDECIMIMEFMSFAHSGDLIKFAEDIILLYEKD